MKRLCLSTIAIVFLLGPPAAAEPLQPAHVSKDAKWILHWDFDTMRASTYGDDFEATWGKTPWMKSGWNWMQKRYGIQQGDLHGATMYGDSYREHRGTLVLYADFDRQKIVEVIESQPGFKTAKYLGYTLYTWNVEGKGKAYEKDAEKKRAMTVTAAFHSPTVALMSSDEVQVKSALDRMNGRQPNIAGMSTPLLRTPPAGSFFYGAAIHLEGLQQRKDHSFAVLQKLKECWMACGEKPQEITFCQAHFVGHDAEVVSKLKEVAEGLRAMIDLQIPDDFKLAHRLIDNLKIKLDGSMLNLAWTGTTEDVYDAVESWRERYGDRREEMEDVQE